MWWPGSLLLLLLLHCFGCGRGSEGVAQGRGLRLRRRVEADAGFAQGAAASLIVGAPAAKVGYSSGPVAVDVYGASRLLDGIKAATQRQKKSSDLRFDALQQVFSETASSVKPGSPDMALLDEAQRNSQVMRSELDATAVEMSEFYYTVKAVMGSQEVAPNCKFLACGAHAVCRNISMVGHASGGARCECKSCFVGDGLTCRPGPCSASSVSAKPILAPLPPGYPIVPREVPGHVAELQLTLLKSGEILAAAFRDASRGNRGVLVLGRPTDSDVEWGTWQPFSDEDSAFGPVLCGLGAGRRLALAYRDEAQGGVGYLVGAQLNATDDLRVIFGGSIAFARWQAERAVLVPLAAARVALIYAEAGQQGPGRARGAAGGVALVRLGVKGALGILGRYGFAQGLAVSRLSAAALTPTSFVVAYSAENALHAEDRVSRELSAVWMGVMDGELVVDPHSIALEPERKGMGARDVALISQNLIAYSYESITDRSTKMTIIRVDPTTHRMTITGGPQVIARGGSSFVRSISLPSGPMPTRTFTYFQRPGANGMAEVCRVSPEGRISNCHDVMWADSELAIASGIRLHDGRLAFVFASPAGKLFYQLLGSEDAGEDE
mmetsp:Transcript_89714/g.192299  ORF Transcript_89714/g.192299 Transcript_89714/m.192299 type:complete len:609 (+) Transcript_89714:117-1943(+)